MKLFSMVCNLNFYFKFIAVIAWSWLHSKLSTDSRPPLTHGFKQGVFFYKTETFFNPTNTEGAVNKKLNILVSFYHVSSSRFFFKVIQSHRLQSVFFKKMIGRIALFSYYLQGDWAEAFEINILQTCLSSTSLFFACVVLNLLAKVLATNVITLRRVI